MNDLEMLAKRFAGLLVKRPGFCMGLWGEAGIGKTHTVQGLLRGLACQHLSVHATATTATLLQQLPNANDVPVWAQRGLAQAAQGEVLANGRLVDALVALMGKLAPFVLHLEDVHEADAQQVAFLEALARVVPKTKGLALLVTSRAVPPSGFEAIKLAPLSDYQTKTMLDALAGAELPKDCVAWMQQKSLGNPLFTVEFFRFLSRQGFVWNDGRFWHWRKPQQEIIPITIEALIEHVLARSTSRAASQRVLYTKAMLGHGVSPGRWCAATGLGVQDLNTELERLGRDGVLLGEEFVHPLYGELFLRGLDAPHKQGFARQAARALDATPEIAALFVPDAAWSPEETLGLLQRAADALAQRGDVAGAGARLAQAVAVAPSAARPALALEAARLMRHVNVPEAMRLAHLAKENAAQHDEATHLLAELLAIQGHGQEAERALQTCSDQGSRVWWQRVLQLRGVIQNDTGVLEILRDHPDVLVDADAATLSRAARTLANHGEIERAETLVANALDAPNATPHDRILLLKASAMIAYVQSDYARMEATERQVLALAQELGNLRWVDAAYFNRALALEALGDHAGRMQMLELAMQTCMELGDATALAIAQSSYGNALHASAKYEHAEKMLLEAHTMLRALDVTVYLVDCESGLVRLYLDWQPPHGALLARKYAQAALQHAQTLGVERLVIDCECQLAQLEAHNNQGQEALERTTKALAVATRLGIPVVRANVLATHGFALESAGNAGAAVAAWREAESLLHQTGDFGNAHMVGLETDRVLGNAVSARQRQAWFEGRGLKNNVLTVLRYFPAPTSAASQSATSQSATVQLEVRLEVLGVVQILVNGQAQHMAGQKRQALLVLLLEARMLGRAGLGKLELMEALYPEAFEDQAARSLKQAVRFTRETLGAGAIQTTTTGYALGALDSDAEDFLKTKDTRLWRGVYRAGLNVPSDETLAETLHLALVAAIKATLPHDAQEAARVAELLLQSDPYNHDALMLLLQALQMLGKPKTLERVYGNARQAFLEVGTLIPERWQDFLGVAAA